MKRLLAALVCAVLCISILAVDIPARADERVSARTTLSGSAWAKLSNIEIAVGKLNGRTVSSGAEFSFNEAVGPCTKAYGYQTAANGRGAKVTGGGVAQVATTLYLALNQLDSPIEYTQINRESGFTDNYVSNAQDAILVDETNGFDFSFVNYGDDLIIEMWITDRYLYCALTAAPEENAAIESAELLPSFRRAQARYR